MLSVTNALKTQQLVNYFKSLSKTDKLKRDLSVLNEIIKIKTLTRQAYKMINEVSKEEIEKTLLSMSANKSFSLNGRNVLFFKKA